MAVAVLQLRNKTVVISRRDGVSVEKIGFAATLADRGRFVTFDGVPIPSGSVTMFFEKPEYPTETIDYCGAFADPDSGRMEPASFAVNLLLGESEFLLLRDCNNKASIQATLWLPLHGSAIQFDSPLGESLMWNTSLGRSVSIEALELRVSPPVDG